MKTLIYNAANTSPYLPMTTFERAMGHMTGARPFLSSIPTTMRIVSFTTTLSVRSENGSGVTSLSCHSGVLAYVPFVMHTKT